MAKLFRMKRPKVEANSKLERYKIEPQSSFFADDELCDFQNKNRENLLNLKGSKTFKDESARKHREVECLMKIHLRNIEKFLKEIQCERELDNRIEDEAIKFKFAALVMDHFFLVLTFTYSLVTFGV
jgi:hypothetical protein